MCLGVWLVVLTKPMVMATEYNILSFLLNKMLLKSQSRMCPQSVEYNEGNSIHLCDISYCKVSSLNHSKRQMQNYQEG